MRKQRSVVMFAALCSGFPATAQSLAGAYPEYLFTNADEPVQSAWGADAAGAAEVPPQGRQPDPDWINWIAPGEWCGTTQRYMAELAALGLDPSRAVCEPMGPCDDPWMRDASIPDATTPAKTVQLSIHVFCESDGTNCGATLADVDAAVARLSATYAPWGFQFVYVTEFVNNSRYRNITNNEGMMKHRYADSPTTMLNVYVVNTEGFSWGTFPWSQEAQTAYGGIVMDDSVFVFNPTTFTHEVGHCLGLYHVFHGVDEVPPCSDCYEVNDPGTDRDITGDLCSDTYPTPRNSGNCFDPEGTDACSGNAWGAWGQTPYQNYMSYAHFGCNIEFTAQQAGRMHCWTEDLLSGWLVAAPPPNVPGTPVLTSQGGGQILVSWSDNSTDEDGFRIERARKQKNKWVESQVTDVGADVTSILDAPGPGTFRYRVRAYNSNGDSAWSAWTQINN